jgi:hypothetical protein
MSHPLPSSRPFEDGIAAFLATFQADASRSHSYKTDEQYDNISLLTQNRLDMFDADLQRHAIRHPTPRSTTTSTASSTTTDEIFDETSLADCDSTTGVTTAPPRRERLPQFTARDQMLNPGMNMLPCEFVGYSNCDRKFHLHDTEQWIDHIMAFHLRYELPNDCFCWYCDDFIFDSVKNNVDRVTNFRNRLDHVREHFVHDVVTIDRIRPDFAFIKHLGDRGMISKDVYDGAQEWNEGPVSKAPIYKYDYVPEEHRKREERKKQVLNDQATEDRQCKERREGVLQANCHRIGRKESTARGVGRLGVPELQRTQYGKMTACSWMPHR